MTKYYTMVVQILLSAATFCLHFIQKHIHMKWLSFSLISALLWLLPPAINAQEAYEKRVERYTSTWEKLIPRYTKLQFAGSIGIVAAGVGWNYGKNHWETDVLLGLVPGHKSQGAMVTFTAKQNYYPWNIALNDKFYLEPLSCSLFINTLLNGNFWVTNPEKYPKGYYTFSTRMRLHASIGQRITLKLDKEKFHNKSISLFYEIGTCDLYLINAVRNSYLKPSDYLSLSIGVKFQIL